MYRLRELQREDIPILNKWRNDPELIACLGSPFRYINPTVDYEWFDSYMRSRETTIRCAIIDDKNEFIGLISLVHIDHLNQSAELHIMIGSPESCIQQSEPATNRVNCFGHK